jgi:hypothetical protein
MNPKLKKILMVILAVVLLLGVSRVQSALNRDRASLGLTRIEPLENAPPVLAFTTVALGGFRGLISNALWIRASDLQDEDKFFEMFQLADWITRLEPHFVQVWLVQAWNMAYNISIKFKDFPDRWRWVERGIELLRDDGLRFNPNETLIYRELAWFFQHKVGQNLDDANIYFKQQWANQMAQVFAKAKPNLDELINPQTDDAKARARLLHEKYKMDPRFMKEVDQRYGPIEWRLPEAHAIYWAAVGLEKAKENPTKIKQDDLITLRRVIYQSMQMSFQRGRLISNQFAQAFEFGPNLDIIPKVSAAYEQAAEEDTNNHDHILKAHRNFLRDAIYFLYQADRVKDAAYWFKYLADKYPNNITIDGNTNSFPRNVTLDQYVLARVGEDVNETSQVRVTAVIEGMLLKSYEFLALDEDERFEGYQRLARLVWKTFMGKLDDAGKVRVGLKPIEDFNRDIRNRLLDPEKGMPFEARAVLRTKLNLPPEPKTTAAETNGPPTKISQK